MAGVFIDIPGIGNIEAKNAATESTLRELLKVMQGVQKNTGGGSGPGGGGGGGPGGGGGGPGGGGGGPGGGGGGFFSKAITGAGKTIGGAAFGIGKAAGVATGVLGKMATGAGAAVGAVVGLAEKGFQAADALSKLDGSASGAAEIFSGIPILGTIFKAVAGAADRMVSAINEATSSGASFGGSISSFTASANAAGMNLKEFASLISKNGAALGAFGSTSEDGAKRFASVSKQLRSTSSELYALGFSSEQINQGLANYGKLLRIQGAQGTMTNAQLAAGAKNYLKEMDLLAKVTGKNRADLEAEREALQKDAQLRAALAGLGPDVQASVHSMIQSMPSEEMKLFAKDILANGTATTDANRLIMSQMPGLAAELQRMHSQTQKNVAINKDQMNSALNQGKQEAKVNLQRVKTAVAADEAFRPVGAALGSMAELNVDAVKTGQAQQEQTKKTTDGFNEKMNKMRETLNRVANTFTEFLASSGFLDLLIKAVEFVADLAMNVLFPALQALERAIRPVIEILMKVFPPVLAVVSAAFEKIAFGIGLILQPVIDRIKSAFEGMQPTLESFKGAIEFLDGIINFALGALDATVRGVMIAFDGLWEAVTGLFGPIKELWNSLTDLYHTVFGAGDATDGFMRILIEVGDIVGQAFKILGAITGTVIGWMTDLVKGLTDFFKTNETAKKYLGMFSDGIEFAWRVLRKYFSVDGIKSLFEDVVDGFLALIDSIRVRLPEMFGGISEEEKKKRDEERADRAKARDEKLEANLAERNAVVERQLQENRQTRKQIEQRNLYTEANRRLQQRELSGRQAAAQAAEMAKDQVDYTAGPEALLKQFGKVEGSSLIPTAQSVTGVAVTEQERVNQARSRLASIRSVGAASGDTAQTAEAMRRTIETEAETRRQEQTAANSRRETAAAQQNTATRQASGPEGTARTTQENATTLLTELNNKMAQLINLTAQTQNNTAETAQATRGLSKDLFRSI